MRTKQILAVIAFASLFAIAACGSVTDTADTSTTDSAGEAGTYQTLAIDDFAVIVTSDTKDYTIINVHIPYAGEIDGTDANIPFNDLDALTSALPDKDAPIILYCRSGNMSEQASRALIDLGYTRIWDVPGGMIDWQASGRKLIDK
jgi:rhodanese-related sulfurtransferase